MHQNSTQRLPLTVSQLTQAIKLNLESMFPLVYMQGEISNFKEQSSGHLYFSLKDANAQIAAVMFKGEASSLKILPKGGDQVIVKGELNVYPPKGNYQLIIRELSYVGLGELLQRLEELKIKLHRLGWFKTACKKALPRFPKRIGVITSPTGAVIQDILNILSRRFSGFHLILNPVKVQGEGAAQEIAQAVKQFNDFALADVLIVGRGGGSLEDLWAFNEEIVAEAIYHSHIPIISAVGHETDHCIADYVADVRAPTPSAAAEIVIPEKQQQLDYLQHLRKRMRQTIGHLVQQDRYRLDRILKHPLVLHPQTCLEWRMQKLDDYRQDIKTNIDQLLQFRQNQLKARAQQALALKPTNQILYFKQRFTDWDRSIQQQIIRQFAQNRQKLNHMIHRLDHLCQNKYHQYSQAFKQARFSLKMQEFIQNHFSTCHQKISYLSDLLDALNPKNLLEKGYSILFAEKSSFVINSIQKLEKGQQAKLLLSDGEVLITINEVNPREYDSYSRPRTDFN